MGWGCDVKLSLRVEAAEFDRINKAGSCDAVAVPALPWQIRFMNNENEFDFQSKRSVINEIMDAIKDGVKMTSDEHQANRVKNRYSLTADQILSSLVGKLVHYIAVPVYFFQYNGNLEEFTRQLGELELAAGNVKLKVEAAKTNGEVILVTVEVWLKRVHAVSVESQGFKEEEDAISKRCFNGPLNLKVRYQRSRKAKKKALEIMDAIKKAGSFDSVSVPAPPLPIGSLNNENEFDFESRRSVINKIMDAIKDDGVEMIGIWGMPGIGKTILVKRVAKYAEDEGLFEVVAMAVVSQNLSVKDIQGQIADAIGLILTSESEVGRAGQLRQRLLAMKKILVILDDIWDSIELNDIGIPSGTQHKGCKIILTSRRLDVCEQMRTEKNFKIDTLLANEALDLFLKMSGVDNRYSQKGRLAEELSKECGGLILAIVIVARGLLNKELFYWTDTLTRLRNSDIDSKLRATNELSYNNLDIEGKMFFLLCALFPEDYRISVQVLFEYGIGLELFEKVKNLDQALERAHKLASRLKSSCVLLDAESDEEGKEFVKIHDVIRDVALAITSDGKNAFLARPVTQWREWQEKTAISLWNDDVKKLPDKVECPRLEILMLNGRYQNWQLRDNFFTGMKNLMVLDMAGMECVRLPQSFAALKNLLTLRFSFCKLEDISTIGKLQNLVSLSFCDSYIEVLPEEVGELSNLRLLDLSNCFGLKVITSGVFQNLSQLEVLLMRRFLSRNKPTEDYWPENAVVSELIYLPSLMILEIHLQDASRLPDEILFQKLTKFKISIGGAYPIWKGMYGWDSQILKLTCISENELTKDGIKTLMKKAQHLELEDVSGISVALPSLQLLSLINLPLLKEIWHGDHPTTTVGELSVLTINHCDTLLEIFPSNLLGGVQNLKRLQVESCGSLEHVFAVKDHPPILSNLLSLSLNNLPKLKQLWWNENTCENFGLPNLCELTIEECPALQFVLDPSVGSCLENLRSLNIINCSSIVEIVAENPGEKIEFPLLDKLCLINLPCFKVNQSVEFPQAKIVVVERCFNMKKPYQVNVERDGNIQLQGSMSFFESLVEGLETGTLIADDE